MSGKVVLLASVEVWGLGCGGVLIADPAAVLVGPLGRNDLYVAMTRATRWLGVVHPGLPPVELRELTVS
ncbi:hypothetical protein [Actinophytocola sp.]|uniref:hypothetical protein n=1 Tax=Actinophytocola sp. TaxID=1872138 RepID=UPI002ED4EFA4